MIDLSVEFTLSLPSKEHLALFNEIAEEGRLGEFLSQSFIQAYNGKIVQDLDKQVENKINALDGKMDIMQQEIIKSVMQAIANNANSVSSNSNNIEEPIKPIEKPKEKPKRRTTNRKPGNPPGGGGLAALMAKSQEMNSKRRND